MSMVGQAPTLKRMWGGGGGGKQPFSFLCENLAEFLAWRQELRDKKEKGLKFWGQMNFFFGQF